MNLRTPGPIPVPAEVAQAGAAPMINHRGPEFAELMAALGDGLQYAYRTENDVLVLTGSGTSGLEAAVVNHVSPGDRVLVVTVGVFGERFVELVNIYGGDCRAPRLRVRHGRRPEPHRRRPRRPTARSARCWSRTTRPPPA